MVTSCRGITTKVGTYRRLRIRWVINPSMDSLYKIHHNGFKYFISLINKKIVVPNTLEGNHIHRH